MGETVHPEGNACIDASNSSLTINQNCDYLCNPLSGWGLILNISLHLLLFHENRDKMIPQVAILSLNF